MHAFHRLIVVLGISWRVLLLGVAAQNNNISFPQCSVDSFTWTYNAEHQNPCQVAAALQGVCYGGTWQIQPLAPGNNYGGPSKGISSVCQCNPVVFSLVSACGACQGVQIPIPWSTWKFNCSSTDVISSGFPLTIPQNTSVPAWAYLDVTASDSWNQSASFARASSGAPDVKAGTPPSTAYPAGPTPGGSHASKGSRHTNAGAIAGGVVGGAVGLCALALAAFVLYRRVLRPRPRSVIEDVHEDAHMVAVASPTSASGTAFFSHFSHSRSPSDDPPKLYDPSDPSTFPPSPAQLLPYQSQTSMGTFSTQNQGGPPFPQPQPQPTTNYRGIPEI